MLLRNTVAPGLHHTFVTWYFSSSIFTKERLKLTWIVSNLVDILFKLNLNHKTRSPTHTRTTLLHDVVLIHNWTRLNADGSVAIRCYNYETLRLLWAWPSSIILYSLDLCRTDVWGSSLSFCPILLSSGLPILYCIRSLSYLFY